MTGRPPYFETIRTGASQRWDQLESDPELAGPWHQLFKQVQSPRHVVSELLQNADDAGATEASVTIQDGEFVFSHNGEDFCQEHFASLCRFGYSNKRALHTIGFRGVGFKSTFSLGDNVRLLTPTLSVVFQRQRFTEPEWITHEKEHPGQTVVRVPIKDDHRRRELEKNLKEWDTNPASLLFFRSVRCLRVGEKEVRWQSAGVGPIARSEWVTISTVPESRYLLIQSVFERFPDDALYEIRQERMVTIDEDVEFPPCRVEIVLGMEGRFFVILPTGISTKLPFACNAPFVQDPARVTIKAPATSPTNRWLLNRIGKLAAEAMLAWLKRVDLSDKERCEAYKLLPDIDRNDNSPEGACANIIKESFLSRIEKENFLLAKGGQLTRWKGCVAVPKTVLQIWSTEQVSAFFIEGARPILSDHVSHLSRIAMISWGCVEEIDKSVILRGLKSKHLPKPETWQKLLTLWEYVSADVTGYHQFREYQDVKIVPVHGREVLYAAGDVVRMGEKKILRSQDDWEFLSQYLLVTDQSWLRFLPEQRREAAESKNKMLGQEVKSAFDVLEELKLHFPSDSSSVIGKVAAALFSKKDCTFDDCVRLSHLAAALNASVPDSFQYVTRKGQRVGVTWEVLVDLDGGLGPLVDRDWYDSHVLHDGYLKDFKSCTAIEWKDWVNSDRSGLCQFFPLKPFEREIWGRGDLKEVIEERGFKGDLYFHYRTDYFIIEDWNFHPSHWERWYSLAKVDSGFWGRLFSRILEQPIFYWENAASARIQQIATTGNRKAIVQSILPAWIVEFRTLPCLQDTWGQYRHPTELLRRTPETESLLDVDPFVRGGYDTEATRPLLKLLGVRDTPTGPDRLLERLCALAQSNQPPVHEVEKWYHRLDQMTGRCSTDDAKKIKDAFYTQKIVFTGTNCWAKAAEVFIAADEEDVPGAAVIYPSVSHLSLWRKIGIAERPTADLAINWLKSLPFEKCLTSDELRRIRSILPRYPDRIWNECGHWLNLEGEWVVTADLVYSLTMQSLIHWKNLFTSYKKKTADFQKLSNDVCHHQPFSGLPTLAAKIEDRFDEEVEAWDIPQRKPWLFHFGSNLKRIVLENSAETARIREIGGRLTKTTWQTAKSVKTTPYIDGAPAGTPRSVDVVWKDSTLYVQNKPIGRLFKSITQEVGRPFNRSEISEAIWACVDRSPEFVDEYIENNFDLEKVKDSPTETEKSPEPTTTPQPQQPTQNGSVELSAGASAGQGSDLPTTATGSDTSEENQESEQVVINGSELGQNAEGNEGKTEETQRAHTKKSKPTQPSLIERFAVINGYFKDNDNRFNHPDGKWLGKVSGNSFPWELKSSFGELIQSYWAKDICIQREPLQLNAEIWNACYQFPQKYSVILSDHAGRPVEFSGERLKEMYGAGELTLYPATYRLVYEQKQNW